MEKKKAEAMIRDLFKNSKVVLYLILILMHTVTVLLLAGSEPDSMLFNLVFLAAMAALIFAADRRGMQVLEQAARDCRTVREKIEELTGGLPAEDGAKNRLWDLLKQDPMVSFSDAVLDRSWKNFCRKKNPDEIEEALDENLILERSQKGYCEMVPGFLTALGILGTFLGLVMSMESFSFDSADQIEATMENIVSGIHVAFYTSIYGVALSIVYNIIYRSRVQKTCDELFELQETVHRNLPPLQAENSGKELAELHTEELLTLRNIEASLGKGLSKELGDAVSTRLQPIFTEINQSLKRVIGDFRAEQSASLSYIVEAFVRQMSEQLDSHINVLGGSVERLSRSQEEMTTELNGLLQEISRTARDTGKINEESKKILFRFETYMDRLNSMQGHVNDTFGIVENYTKELYDSMNEQSRMIAMMQEHEKQIMAACSSLEKIQTDFARQTDANLSVTQKMAEHQEEFRENLAAVLQKTGSYEQKMFDILTELKAVQLSAVSQTQKAMEAMREERQEGERAAREYRKELEQRETSFSAQRESEASAHDQDLRNLQLQTNELLLQLIRTVQESREQTFLKRCGNRLRNRRFFRRNKELEQQEEHT